MRLLTRSFLVLVFPIPILLCVHLTCKEESAELHFDPTIDTLLRFLLLGRDGDKVKLRLGWFRTYLLLRGSLRLGPDGPDAWLEADLPCDAIDAFEDATLDEVQRFVESVEKIIRTNVVKCPYQRDPAIRVLSPIHLLIAIELVSLQLAKFAFVRVEKLYHVDLLAVLESGL